MDDWLAIWDAADEADRSAAVAHVTAKATAACESEVSGGMTGASSVPPPEVIDARRVGDRLIATLGWTYWVYHYAQSGSDWSEQTIGLDEITVEAGAVVGERGLGTRCLHFSENDQLDVKQQFRETVGEMRDRLAILGHVTARLQAECDARGTTVARPVTVELIEERRTGERSVARTCGWYRVYAPASADRSTRYIAIDEITIERGTIVNTQTIARVDGTVAATDALAEGLDAEHVRYVSAQFRTSRDGVDGIANWKREPEERRRLVLTAVTERAAAACRARGLKIVDGPHASAIDARRTSGTLVVVSCVHYRLRDIACAELVETSVFDDRVFRQETLVAREERAADDNTARAFAEDFVLAYPAVARVRAQLAAEHAALQRELGGVSFKPPQIVVLAVDRAGTRMMVTTSGSFSVWPRDDERPSASRSGTQSVSIDTSTIEDGIVIGERRLFVTRLAVQTVVGAGHDEAAAAAAVVAEFRRSS